MRDLLLAAILVATGASAQTTVPTSAPAAAPQPSTPAAGYGWDRVHALPVGTPLHVKTTVSHKVDCVFVSATEDTLNCGGATFQRHDIQSIKIAHRLRSTLSGLGIGYGAGVAITSIALSGKTDCGYFGCNPRCNSLGCLTAVGVVDLGLLVASPIIGHITDFTAHTIYKTN